MSALSACSASSSPLVGEMGGGDCPCNRGRLMGVMSSPNWDSRSIQRRLKRDSGVRLECGFH
jgi:hypothetical protein